MIAWGLDDFKTSFCSSSNDVDLTNLLELGTEIIILDE